MSATIEPTRQVGTRPSGIATHGRSLKRFFIGPFIMLNGVVAFLGPVAYVGWYARFGREPAAAHGRVIESVETDTYRVRPGLDTVLAIVDRAPPPTAHHEQATEIHRHSHAWAFRPGV
jgi:hypothetical protein